MKVIYILFFINTAITGIHVKVHLIPKPTGGTCSKLQAIQFIINQIFSYTSLWKFEIEKNEKHLLLTARYSVCTTKYYFPQNQPAFRMKRDYTPNK